MQLPVPIAMAVAIYFTMWWVLLFAILPFGIRSQQEAENVVPGTDPGAPEAPRLAKKALWTTVITTVLFVALMTVMSYFPDA